MRCHFKQFEDAYNILWEFSDRCIDPSESGILFADTVEKLSDEEVCWIEGRTIEYLKKGEWIPEHFAFSVFDALVKRLHEMKRYDLTRELSDYMSLADILKSGCAFECACAYSEKEHPRSVDIYEAIVKENSSDSPAVNNLGVCYEHTGELNKALDCYEKANALSPSNERYQNNLARIKELIYKKQK